MMHSIDPESQKSKVQKLKELAMVFFKLGCIAFGGPAAHIAMMEEEVVRKRKWMTTQHFLDLVGATNLIPGPNSTEMTMHCGHERAGWQGLVVAGVCFIFPAVIITMVFAWFYSKYGQLPEVKPFVYGIKPAVIAIIIDAVIRLGKKAVKNVLMGLLGVLTLTASLLGLHEIMALVACGLLGMILGYFKQLGNRSHDMAPGLVLTAILSPEIWKLFLLFLKVGALLYGSGYVLFAYLDAELVQTTMMTRQQLIDAIAVGQFTPGPVLTTATFVGWQLHGFWGSIAATLGIFLPSFLFVVILNPWIPRMRSSKMISAFLDAVNVGAVAVIVSVCIEMTQEAVTDWRSLLIGLLSLITVTYFRALNAAWIVLGGGLIGYALFKL